MPASSNRSNCTVFLAALTFLAVPLPVRAAQSRQQIPPSAIYERSHDSVVVVIVFDVDSNPIGQGSGFIVGKNRIVTNHHVVEDAAKALVVFADGSSESADGIAADSPAHDLSILVVNTGSRSALKIGNELQIKQGDSVYALGAPRGLELSLTNGIISGFRDADGQFLIQTTAAIAPGSSGGPLFDSSGRVIGVTTSLLSDSPGIYFSVSSTDVQRLLRSPGLILPFRPQIAVPQAPAPVASSSPKASGENLYVDTEPHGASVFVNGIKKHGQTPIAIDLAPGQYDVVLRLYGYKPYLNHLRVAEKQQTKLEAKLEELWQGNPSFVEVATTPNGAEIYVDRSPTGQATPARIRMQPGTHSITMTLGGFRNAQRDVEISEGQVVAITLVLLPL